MQLRLPIDAERQAKADRIAAEYALVDPFRSPKERQERHEYYLREAEKHERIYANGVGSSKKS